MPRVVPTDNWYAAHAAARLDRKFAPRLEPLALSDAEIDALAAEPAFVRTRELLRCEMDAEATAEWRAAYDELPPARQVQAVGLASRWGWHDQAIATAARQKLFNDYDVLYPRPFDADVRSASRRTGPARGTDLRDHPAGEPVSRRRGVQCRRDRPDAAAARDGPPDRATRWPARADARAVDCSPP